jgi:hypothetical protein
MWLQVSEKPANQCVPAVYSCGTLKQIDVYNPCKQPLSKKAKGVCQNDGARQRCAMRAGLRASEVQCGSAMLKGMKPCATA